MLSNNISKNNFHWLSYTTVYFLFIFDLYSFESLCITTTLFKGWEAYKRPTGTKEGQDGKGVYFSLGLALRVAHCSRVSGRVHVTGRIKVLAAYAPSSSFESGLPLCIHFSVLAG